MFQRAIRHADGDLIEVGAARVRLTVSRRARRVSLRVDRAKGEVLAIAPSLRRLGEAGLDFADLDTRESSLEDIFVSLVSRKGSEA